MLFCLIFFLPLSYCSIFQFSTKFDKNEADFLHSLTLNISNPDFTLKDVCEKDTDNCLCAHGTNMAMTGEQNDSYKISTYEAQDRYTLYVVLTHNIEADEYVNAYVRQNLEIVEFFNATGVLKHQVNLYDTQYWFIHRMIHDICMAEEYHNIVFAGNSISGGLAVLAAFECVQLGYCKRNQTKVYTFGAPRTGNCHFAKMYDATVPHTYRVVVKGDPIPAIPSRNCRKGYNKCNDCTPDNVNFYHHVGVEIFYKKNIHDKYVKCKRHTEDRKCSVNYVSSQGRGQLVRESYENEFYLKYYNNTLVNNIVKIKECPWVELLNG